MGRSILPTVELELAARREHGVELVAGIDEAGRGAIAGPVVAAAVILPLDDQQRMVALDKVNDSKQLNGSLREELCSTIIEHALAYGVGVTPAHIIDEMGIIPANARAMTQAIEQLKPMAQYLLLDGRMRLANIPLPQQSVIRGDSYSRSIAAASILAKVTRDRIMTEFSLRFPDYGFQRHKGYCTPQHVASLGQFGPCSIHRLSFEPLRTVLL
ncbi:MAG: ribonuclease HII [Candidatus Promineifilaceae bacterium]|nr:ribonuclease HII [Candidatus Promineifilaceae bacterium]